jgi:D-alanine-D-alanine ligase
MSSSDVVILFGGASSERLVSVASAQNVASRLPGAACWFLAPSNTVTVVPAAELAAHQQPFEVPFAPAAPATWPSLAAALDAPEARGRAFFLALHGGDGENGVTQRLFEARRLAFTGSGSAASAAAFDKAHTKQLAAAQGARIAESRSLPPLSHAEAVGTLHALLEQHRRWVLKPQADGSSHGLIHLAGPQDVEAAAATLSGLGLTYLAEVFIEGRELTVGVVEDPGGLTALPVSEVRVVPGGAFDYAGKYLGRGTEEITPAALTDPEREQAQALALLTHRAVGCAGYSRTDMILTASEPVLLEINTLPGLTKASFIPQQLAAAGRDVTAFLEQQLALARARRDAR